MIDRGLLIFAVILSTLAIIASIFASNVIPTIFKTEDAVIKTQITFNDSQIQTIENLKNISYEVLQISNELKDNQEQHENISSIAKTKSELNVQMTEINANNIQNIMNNISAINQKLSNK